VTDTEWIKPLAEKIHAADKTIRQGNYALAEAWWEIGARLNALYGSPDGKLGVAARGTTIPLDDALAYARELGFTTTIAKNGQPSIAGRFSVARRFATRVKDVARIHELVDEYGCWRNVYQGWLAGATAEEVDAQRLRHDKTERELRKTMRRVGTTWKYPASLTGPLQEQGLTVEEANEAVRMFLERLDWRSVYQIYKRQWPKRA
jgi:hypothetical protein